MTVYNNALYFSANDRCTELWKYDGSNVSLAADINPGSGGSNPSGFCVFSGSLYFAASNSIYGNELLEVRRHQRDDCLGLSLRQCQFQSFGNDRIP